MKFPSLAAALAIFLFTQCQIKQANRPNSGSSDSRPNIVLIMADDLGFSDLGCYGGEIQTPHLDSLAENGLRFSQFYNTSRCCPSRASLLTGLYNHQAGIGHMTTDEQREGYRGHLLKSSVTLAEVLKSAGYHTGMTGKWHVSNTVVQENPEKQLAWLNHQEFHPEFSPLEQYPVNRGFEKYYGNIWGVVDFFDPFSLVNGTQAVREVPDNYYHTDAINDTASAYIREFARDDRPFFLYIAHTAPHWPLHALPEDIEKYKDTYTAGWEAIREARYQRLIEEGILDSSAYPLPPRWKDELSWEENPDKAWDARAMAVHAAMIDRMDQGIGRIIDALKETGELENTLIVFLSDNGASPENCMRYGPGFDRPSQTRDGEKIVYPVDKEVLPGPQTSYASIGQRWANVANTPFRYWKMESFEGGVRTPMIAFWPEGIKAEKGSVTRQTGHVMDFMATFIDIAGAAYPETYNGQQITPLQGKSLKPVFEGRQREGHPYLFNEHEGGRYVRSSEWKLVAPDRKSPWELYRMSEDRTETNNLAEQYPEVVQRMDSLWQQWARANHVW
ncbi:arylsulfatase [Anseongella ginsenosidimutans]|uniref:Arylsulfatase n=1 Tax=Anseongella ginsenosidimutans TaxID=496056 RepID=A0A4R3KYE0_9SPHI|nr:arylsulfatase [Anseongella ginsenosidimutans]QEC51665.1 arylsulfatase [Anseongella ginsenosidimutans]TCS89012.1 arylsulfatase [Anseongella ginsenosidimutans]